MKILGIDPGLAIVGYGVVERQSNKLLPIDFGTIQTKAGVPSPVRLGDVYAGMLQLIQTYAPDAIAFEELFFYNNSKTAIAVAQARGVLVLAAQQQGRDMFEFTPMQIKQAVTGYGHADKAQVQTMVKTLLGLKSPPKPDDAADALAVAICLAHTVGPLAEQFRVV